MLIDEIKKQNMLALKNKEANKRAVYSIIINKYMLASVEARTKGKELTDTDLVLIINKTLKELEEEKAGYEAANRNEKVEEIKEQIATISSYLPKMMSESEIKEEILKLEDRSIPNVMKHFKTNFQGKCDMGLVNKVLKSL